MYKTVPEEWHVKLLLRLLSKDQAVLHAFHFFTCLYKKLKAFMMFQELHEHKSVITVPASLNISIYHDWRPEKYLSEGTLTLKAEFWARYHKV